MPIAATVDGDRVTSVTVRDTWNRRETVITAGYVLDATETGDLLPLTGCEYVTGFEASTETGEPNAPDEAQPLNMQAVSVCFAMDHVDGDHTIDKPPSTTSGGLPAGLLGAPLLSWTRAQPAHRQPETAHLRPESGRRPA